MTIESEIDRSFRERLSEILPMEARSAMADYHSRDSSSAEDVESPTMRSAGESRRRRWWKTVSERRRDHMQHSQVLRIKEEESQILADLIGDYCYDAGNYVASLYPSDDRMVIWSRLPASPLSRRKIG